MTVRPFIEPGLVQLRKLWLPFVAIQLVGLAVVVSYFTVPAVARGLGHVSDLKDRGGLPFAAAALAFACGVVPELVKLATGVDRGRPARDRASFLAHNVVVFALLGCVQVYFYDAIAAVFGDSRRPGIVLAKTAVDMLIYSPLVSVPAICFGFTLRARGYRVGPAVRELGPAWYVREVVPVLVVNMAYWWPMGLLMYTLPPRMTFVFGATSSAASATLMTAIASAGSDELAPGVPLVAAAAD